MAAERKFEITKEELEELVWQMPTTEIAKLYSVSDKAIEKRCKILEIEKPPRGYWSMRTHKQRNIKRGVDKAFDRSDVID
jgi:hypothetical protein